MTQEDDRLEQIRECLRKATPGPWVWRDGMRDDPGNIYSEADHADPDPILCTSGYHPGHADLEFIACSREWVPYLLQRVEELQAERDDLTGKFDRCFDAHLKLIEQRDAALKRVEELEKELREASVEITHWQDRVAEAQRFIAEAAKLHGETCEVKRWSTKLGFGPDPVCSCPPVPR